MNKKYKILKKILSIALCLALILPYTPMPVYAADCVVATEAEFVAALSDSSVDSITLSGDITISRSLDGNDNAFVIPRSVTITGGSLRVERGGIVLGGAVNFKDTEIYLANPVRNAIIANGYPLTLDGVSNGGSSFSIHLFCGGITDYTGGNVSEIPEAGVNGHITIRGENTLGNVYAGSFSDVGNGADDSPNDYTGTAIVTIENSANGFGEIYAHGAREDRSGGNGDGLLPDPELYKASGGVTINLNTPSTITVDGETGGSVDAALNYTDNGKGYRCEPVLKNIGNISLHTISEDEEAKLSPAQGSTFSKNGVIVTLPVNTRLDVTNLATDSSAIAISSLVGGGTLVLDEEQALTISGEVSGNTKVAVGDVSYTGDTCTGMPVEGQTYIVAEESADDNFSLLPPNSNSNMFLSKDNSGNWIIAVSEYTTIVNSISIPESNVEAVDNEGVEISATVMYSSTGDDYLSFVPFIVSVNDKAAEVTYNESYGYTYASGTTGSDIEFYFNIGYDDNEEILVVNNYGYENGIGTGTVPAGTYKISFTVPAENMASGEAYTFTVTLVVCEHAGGTADCTGQIFCEKCGLAYDSGEANAENHTRLTYTVSDNMLRAVCANSACGADCGSITLKTPAGDDLTYDGAAVEATVTSSIANVNPVITYTGDNLVDGKPVNVGEYVATVELGGEKISVAYEIQPAGLTVKNVTAAGRTYNSSNMVTITGVTLEGILLDDKVSVNVNALTGTLSSANAGDYNAVTLPTLALEGDDAKNYSLIQPIDAVATNVTIKKANPETAIHNIERRYLYLRSNVETINIVDLLPDDCGTLTYNISEITGNAEFDAEPAISEGVLTYTLKSGNIGDTASVNVTVITQNYENIMVVVNAELIDQTPVNLLDGTEVTLENNTLIYGEALSKLSFNSAVFVDADGNVVEGELAFREPSDALDVGTTSAEWVFTPDNEEYAQLKGTVNIFVKKATPFVATVPLASAIIYGDTLANSKLTGGIVQYGNGLGEAGSTECVEGTFAWKDNLVKPVVKDSNSTEYTVVFTPLDEVNYNSVETRVTLTVNKVKNPPNMPDSTVNVPYSSKVVDDITLPDGWIWQEADKNVVLEPEIPVGAIAVYTGIDKDNYENVSVEIIITRAECVHVTGEILFTGDGDKAPDCVDAGLGHKECTKCGKTVESGIVTDALGHELSKIEKVEATCTKTGSKEYWHCVVCEKKFGDDQGSKEITDMKVLEIPMEAHTGGTATCTAKAICDICKNEYGELDITNHGEREVKNKKAATCKEPGYTGDTYCKECDTKIVSGKVIEKLITHSWDAGQVTKEATCTEKGETTYTCTVCEVTRTEEASALGHQLSKIGKVEATCAEKGKTIYACTVCGETTTEEIPALGHQLSKIGKVEATCTKTGSKEYWHCSVCEKKFSDDQGSKEITDMTILEIPMEAHTGGTATCTTKAICDVCKKEYGELNISNHGEREVKNRKTATCKAPGYTGDTYCKECDTKIVSGEVIEKLTTHSWDAGKVTKEATCTEKGEITYACTDCEETTTEEIPALSAPKKNAILTDAKNAAKYKVTKAGIQNGTLQYVEPMNKNAKAVRIPVTVTIDGIKYKVTSIAKNAFKNNKRLTEVTIGDNVNIIGTNAFYGCTKLKTVITSKNVTTIGENAFYKCTALEKITISSKVTKIGRNAFYGCKKLKIITIKTKKLTTKNVGSNAFKGIYKKAVIKAPKMKVKAYKTIFKKKGMETMIFRYI